MVSLLLKNINSLIYMMRLKGSCIPKYYNFIFYNIHICVYKKKNTKFRGQAVRIDLLMLKINQFDIKRIK